MSKRLVFIKGEKMNMLTAMEETEPTKRANGAVYRTIICLCDCGNRRKVILSKFKNEVVKSCGCLRLTNLRKKIITQNP